MIEEKATFRLAYSSLLIYNQHFQLSNVKPVDHMMKILFRKPKGSVTFLGAALEDLPVPVVWRNTRPTK